MCRNMQIGAEADGMTVRDNVTSLFITAYQNFVTGALLVSPTGIVESHGSL